MAGRTIAAHSIRIMEKCADECTVAIIDKVANITILVRCYMTERFSFTDVAVMTGQAVAGISAGVVKSHISEVGSVFMAIGTILSIGSRRNVILQFTDTDHIVVARITINDDTGMIIGTSAEGAWSMAMYTVLIVCRTRIVRIGWHVFIERRGKRFADGSNLRWCWSIVAMAGLAVVYEAGVVKYGTNETFGVVARVTISGGYWMVYGRSLSGCINTISIIVA